MIYGHFDLHLKFVEYDVVKRIGIVFGNSIVCGVVKSKVEKHKVKVKIRPFICLT